MLINSVCFVFILQLWIHLSASVLPEETANLSDECLTNSLETLWLCRGSRALQNILNNLSKTDKPFVIVRGLEIVPTPHLTNSTDNNTMTMDTNMIDNVVDGDNDDTFLGRFGRYLRTHELNIKFSELMTDEREQILARDLDLSGMQSNYLNEARKKDKGNGMVMMMALMFSKMMAVMGLGGIGALAMKALGVAMAALMMAALVGVKSLAQQGHESSHSVQYISADGHHHKRRRRRSAHNAVPNLLQGDINMALPLAYRAWRTNAY